MNFHVYVDDTQLYLSFDSWLPFTSENAIIYLESCIAQIKAWIFSNRLKLNGDKTEFLQLLPNTISTKCLSPGSTIHIRLDSFTLSQHAKNLGVIFFPDLSMSAHITAICKVANYYLFCFSCITKYLTLDALKTAVHALISSKVDYCNSLLVDLPMTQIDRLQIMMNSVACLISGVSKYEHITPTLKDLHCLPVDKHILFKLSCMTHKDLNRQASLT